MYVTGSFNVRAQARIKKIMQLDDDVGRVASSVPVVICIFHLCLHVCVCVCVCVFLYL